MSTNAMKPVSADVARTSVQDPSLFINRELSWLAFNERVLALSWRRLRDHQVNSGRADPIWKLEWPDMQTVRSAGLYSLRQP